MLESLEERLTPSAPTQTAGSYTDLVNAIAADTAANTDFVVQITNGFQFNSGDQVSISKLGAGSTLTIEGRNGTNYTLIGNSNRLFTVGVGQNVTFADLTLSGGSVTNSKGNAQGGAILDQDGNLTLSKVIVQGNTVKGDKAEGGGVYASGTATLAIRDSILSDNSAQGVQGAYGTAPGMNGGAGGSAYGGGLYVVGSYWTVTLIGDTLSGNMALGGNGGNGAAGSNATAPNTSGGYGGSGSNGGNAAGGAAYFSVSGFGAANLTILNDPSAPLRYPSTMIANEAVGGTGGNGGAGGLSTGTAAPAWGGGGGGGGEAVGGALSINSAVEVAANVKIGNSAFYANKAAAGNGGRDGFPSPELTATPGGPFAGGGGIALEGECNVTIVNSTVAKNIAIGGPGLTADGGQGWGGGIYDDDGVTIVLDPTPGSPLLSFPPPLSSTTTRSPRTPLPEETPSIRPSQVTAPASASYPIIPPSSTI